MNEIDNGQPAFPCGLASGHIDPLHHGMTLRDYFASNAMTQTMREFSDDWDRHAYELNTFMQWAAERAYAMADAMLRARNKP